MPSPLLTRRTRAGACAAAGLLTLALATGGVAQARSSARFMTAGELHQRLSSPDPAAREAGRHYLLGVVDTLALVREPRTCLGPGVQADALVEAVATQLQARPDLHRYNAASLVREAIAVAFPCA